MSKFEQKNPKLSEAEAMEYNSQEAIKILKEELENVTPADISKLEKQAKEKAMSGDDGQQALAETVAALGSLKSLENWDDLLDRLAKNKVQVIENAQKAGIPDEFNIAVEQLRRAVDYRAKARFPKEYEDQIDQSSKASYEAMGGDKTRDDLLKKKVS